MPKKIRIVTIGSRGDVQPFVALGRGLKAAGYDVRLVTHRNFERFVTKHGLDFAPLAGDPRKLLEMLASEKKIGLVRFIQQMNEWISGDVDEALQDIWDACQDADAIISGFLSIPSLAVAEKLHIPAFTGLLFPVFSPTIEHASVTFPSPNLGPLYNQLTHQIERMSVSFTQREAVNRWRQDTLGLAPNPPLRFPYHALNGERVTYLYGYSDAVIPRPSDWDEHHVVAGYWFLDGSTNWTPPPGLEGFLNAEQPPVYVGFGSLIDRESEKLVEIAVQAVRQAGRRILLLSGWGGLTKHTMSDDVYVLKSAPHDWLFPRVAAVVHHGGAGTTAAGLRAGKPTIVTPFFGDQPFWGAQVAGIGAGPDPIPAADLTVETLTEAITQATTEATMIAKAAAIGEQIRGEDGVARAVAAIQARI